MIYLLFITLIFVAFSKQLAGVFISNSNTTLDIASDYLIIVGLSQVFGAIEIISNGMFTGIGLPKIPATISVTCTLLRIPVAIILMKYFGVNGIWLSISISSVAKGLIVLIVYRFKVLNGRLKYERV